MSSRARPWQIWIDTGGTFTDGIGVSPAGELRRVKILSTSAVRGLVLRRRERNRLVVSERSNAPAAVLAGLRFQLVGAEHPPLSVVRHDPPSGVLVLSGALDASGDVLDGAVFELRSDEEAPIFAARLLTGTPRTGALPQCELRLATTLGTNALLERTGAPVALFVTRGFADLLAIGTQQRPDLFALRIEHAPSLAATVIEVHERLRADGTVLEPLTTSGLAETARGLVAHGLRTAAVALLHSHRNAEHEDAVKRLLVEQGFAHVSCSAELAPRAKVLPRAQTAVVDAYLAPVLDGYLDRVQSRLAHTAPLVMTSTGGLLVRRRFRPKDGLLSGPAGGIVGARRAAAEAGFTSGIGFDMGGTSTDVARFAGEHEYVYEHRVGPAVLLAPALAIETVAAGGGSICWRDGERLRVGPQSAGARPGPASYGAGGPLTLTDVNLLLGRLAPESFEIPVRREPAERRLDELRQQLASAGAERTEEEALLAGLLRIADEAMAGAIRRVSIRRGYDPADHVLVAFGGAGGQHACAVAAQLGMERILVPADAAVLSARGVGAAVLERIAERQVLEPLDRFVTHADETLAALESRARAQVAEDAPLGTAGPARRLVQVRLAGQEAAIEIEWAPAIDLRAAFIERYEQRFGYRPDGRPIEVESIRAIARLAPAQLDARATPLDPHEPAATASRRVFLGGRWREVPCFDRARLRPGARIRGPALVIERHSTTVVAHDWRAHVDGHEHLLLELDRGPARTSRPPSSESDAIDLELFTERFRSLVQEMGERLERTALSTNVKERLDFSCGLLDCEGQLVVNAPHIPVHLGALGLCVRRLAERLAMEPGDVVVTNHPAYGGSHLPDVTVVTPVHVGTGRRARLLGYVASRAHHAEIGGVRPGSMPPAATRLAEEGVVLAPAYLIRSGRGRWDELQRRLAGGPFPSRDVAANLADLHAALAANHAGARALVALVAAHGEEGVRHAIARLKDTARSRMAAALRGRSGSSHAATEQLDDGTPLAVRIEFGEGTARFDFTGSGGIHPGNLNATPAIVRSVVLYVLRLLIDEPLPLNEGLLADVTIEIPAGLLNPSFPDDPLECPAVVGGNVETSQRLVDTLLKALGLAACSQGTMNNLLFGGARYGYYETLGGGTGAGPAFDGASAVHSHMTNTRITDAEVVEHRYPVRVERFAIRRGSGGRGRFRGGDGLVRELVFLEPASLSILSQHRRWGPYGVAGGEPGAPGRQWVVRANGEHVELGSIDGCDMMAGDRVVIETPGGGGWGDEGR